MHNDVLVEISRSCFSWCLSNARGALCHGDHEQALAWCSSAAWQASSGGFFGDITSRELELLIREAAVALPRLESSAPLSCRCRFLHVFTEASSNFGHSNLCRRWIQNDSRSQRHDVLLTSQFSKVPDNLRETVESREGKLVVLDASRPRLERAAALRDYALKHADFVVLHIHMNDVVAIAAFSGPGGPPVLFLNHADHLFWVGVSVADLVLDIRDSGHSWSKKHRGVREATILPIPLTDPHNGSGERSESLRWQARQRLGIPTMATVVLTVGRADKYEKMPGLDFLEVAKHLLIRNPNVVLLAVGPKPQGRWKALSANTGGRFRPLGVQSSLRDYHLAADIYAEGFPFGSLTAMLEAGLAGLPCVRAPETVPLPFASDGEAFTDLVRPRDCEDYIAAIERLVVKHNEAAGHGQNLRRRIVALHCAAGWLASLEKAVSLAPSAHRICFDFQPSPIPGESVEYWVAFQNCKVDESDRAAELLTRFTGRLFVEGLQEEPGWYAELERMLRLSAPDLAGELNATRLEKHRRRVFRKARAQAFETKASEMKALRRPAAAVRFALAACWANPRNLLRRFLYVALAQFVLGNRALAAMRRCFDRVR